jgi:histidinol phosphatase-like enzyme
MLLQAAQDLDLDLAASWMVGDKGTDIEAARRARIGRIVLLDPTAAVTTRRGDYWRAPSLASVTAPLDRALGITEGAGQ